MFLFVTVLALAPAPALKFDPHKYLYDSVWLQHYEKSGPNYIIKFYKDRTFQAIRTGRQLEDGCAGTWRFEGKTFILTFLRPRSKGSHTFVFTKIEKDLMVGKSNDRDDVRFIKLAVLDKDELEKREREKDK